MCAIVVIVPMVRLPGYLGFEIRHSMTCHCGQWKLDTGTAMPEKIRAREIHPG